MSRIIVVGGGIVGLSSALALQGRGREVELVEDPSSDSAPSWGNAGHVAVEQVEPLASRASIASMPARLFSRGGAASFPPRHVLSWLPFGLRLLAASSPERFRSGQAALESLCAAALPAWRDAVRAIGAPSLLVEDGHFVFWETDASADAGFAAWRSRPIGSTRLRPVTRDELERIQALVRPRLANGVRFEGSASISDLPALRTALRSKFAALGGRTTRSEVVRISDLDADQVVVAAGFGSAKLMRATGHRVPLIAERGYHLEAAATDWPLELPPVVLEDRSLILTRFRGGLRAASFVEFGGDGSRPDRRKWGRLRDHVSDLGIAFEDVTEWMGARPTLPDYLPAIGRSTRDPRIVYAFGHQHLGLTLGPLTAKLVAALVEGREPTPSLRPFALERFG